MARDGLGLFPFLDRASQCPIFKRLFKDVAHKVLPLLENLDERLLEQCLEPILLERHLHHVSPPPQVTIALLEIPVDNPEIARVLEEVADILEIRNENPFRIRAYRNATRTVEGLTTPLRKWVEENRPLTDLPGIGKEMASHIREMVETGTLGFRDELLGEVPRSLIELMRLPALGPKKAKKIFDELKVGSIDELEAAAKDGR